jgi:glutathione S-transferase
VGWSLASRYEPHDPEVVARNPNKQVPVLVDGDLTVCDSTLIFEYLEDRCPDPRLYPDDAPGRALPAARGLRGRDLLSVAVERHRGDARSGAAA